MSATVLYDYQKKGVSMIRRRNGRALLADEMGLGKTLQALKYIEEDDVYPAVVVCPASLKGVWEDEAARHLGLRARVLSGTHPRGNVMAMEKLVIVNYEILHHWLPILKRMKPKIVVCDEAHYLQNHTTRRWRAVAKLRQGVKKLLLITGTPITNRPINGWALLRLLRPARFTSRLKYAFRYCGPRKGFIGYDFSGASHLDELNEVLKKAGMIRRRKCDVLKDLPDKRHCVVPLDTASRREYDSLAKQAKSWMIEHWHGGMPAHRRMEGLALAGEMKREAARIKMPFVFEWIDKWLKETDEKLIVFAIHKKIIGAMRERYAGECVVVTGDTPTNRRTDCFEAFNSNKKTRLLFGNLLAAGTGWSSRQCSNVVKVEIDYVPGNHAQAANRVHGLGRGQKGVKATCWWLVARGTVEEKLCRMVQAKAENIDRAVDGQKYDELPIHDELMKMIREG